MLVAFFVYGNVALSVLGGGTGSDPPPNPPRCFWYAERTRGAFIIARGPPTSRKGHGGYAAHAAATAQKSISRAADGALAFGAPRAPPKAPVRGRRCSVLFSFVLGVFVVFVVRLSWPALPFVPPVRFRCPSRSSAARLLWRLRAARRWWWSARFGSRSFVAPPPGSLRALVGRGRFSRPGLRVAVVSPGVCGAVWSSRVPPFPRVRR